VHASDANFVQEVKAKYQYPASQLTNKAWLAELSSPIDIHVEEIKTDLQKFVKDFPLDIIPHMTEQEFLYGNRFIKGNIDKIHTGEYKYIEKPENSQKSVHYSRHKLSRQHIDLTFTEIKSDRIARMIGLISHFVYWSVFGHISSSSLDDYHTKQLFISIA
jgi:hypothetical protein